MSRIVARPRNGGSCWVSAWAIEGLLKHSEPFPAIPGRIYISRRGNAWHGP